jgi:4a-hydroxytetrahydrobiopterin dehydratase
MPFMTGPDGGTSQDGRMDDGISAREFGETRGTEDWRVIGDGAAACFHAGSFGAATRLAAAIGSLDGIEDHRPDIDVRDADVTVRLLTATDDYYGMSRRDVALGMAISSLARQHGATADPGAVSSVLVIVESIHNADIMPFWRALLGYEERPDSADQDLVDPQRRGPAFWFEEVRERHDVRNGIHVAIWVPKEDAKARVAAALAAGGRLVDDSFAPSGWLLADAMGNEADVASIAGRD